MLTSVLTTHNGLRTAARLPAVARPEAHISSMEMATLLLAGVVAAAATGFMRAGLRIPGSSIVLSALPIGLGLALVPRRGAGSIMAVGAFLTAAGLSVGGFVAFGPGAMTSLCLTGPMMDVAVAGAGAGWRLYAGLVTAGFAANLLALLQRAAAKLLGLEQPGTRLFAEWWRQAVITYAISGAAAGLLAAICWFKVRSRPAR